jgi:hypothetical protein
MKKENAMPLKQVFLLTLPAGAPVQKQPYRSFAQPGIAAAAMNDAGKRKE